MEEFAFLQPLLLTITGLIIGALLKSLLKHSRFPYTVGLFAIGLLVGILNRTGIFNSLPQITEAVDSVADINPDLILYLFLPILIFDAAYELNMHIFKKTLANATLLAAPGLVICMILTGVLMVGIGLVIPGYENWTWAFALMFGASISATDPVAVVALLHELKTSKRFSTLVDAESLLNDGTGIVCFMLFFGVYAATGGSDSSPVMEFIKVISISTILGYFLARVVIWFITRINSEEMIQNSVIILSAYVTFIISQFYMECVRSTHTDIYFPQPVPLRHDFDAISCNEKNGLRTDKTRIGNTYMGRITWRACHDFSVDGIIYQSDTGRYQKPDFVFHCRYSYTDSLYKRHNNALAAQQAWTDQCSFGKSKTGLQYPQAYQRKL